MKEELNLIFFAPAVCPFHSFHLVLVMKLDRWIHFQLQRARCLVLQRYQHYTKQGCLVLLDSVFPNKRKETVKKIGNKTK